MIVSRLVRVLDTTKAGLMCKAFLRGRAFEREWQRTGRGWRAIRLDPGLTCMRKRGKDDWVGTCPVLMYRIRKVCKAFR